MALLVRELEFRFLLPKGRWSTKQKGWAGIIVVSEDISMFTVSTHLHYRISYVKAIAWWKCRVSIGWFKFNHADLDISSYLKSVGLGIGNTMGIFTVMISIDGNLFVRETKTFISRDQKCHIRYGAKKKQPISSMATFDWKCRWTGIEDDSPHSRTD